MDVLISWSKPQSRAVAKLLHSWLPEVLPGVRPWMSDKDIAKGKEWFAELKTVIADARSCIVCLTAENVRETWIYFEAGGICAKKDDIVICSYLIGLDPSSLAGGPLAQFQATQANKDDTLELVRSLNTRLAIPHNAKLIDGNFNHNWPQFGNQLVKLPAATKSTDRAATSRDDAPAASPTERIIPEIVHRLTMEAKEILTAASLPSPRRGSIILFPGGADRIEAGNRPFTFRDDQSRSAYRQAVRMLEEDKLVEVGFDLFAESYTVTAKGHDVADVLFQCGYTVR